MSVNSPQASEPVDTDHVRQFFSLLTSCLDVIKEWADKVPGFSELCKEDQELLFQSACLELLVFRLAYRYVYTPLLTEKHVMKYRILF
jgi:nuclear receptor subfamily 4 group A protein 2